MLKYQYTNTRRKRDQCSKKKEADECSSRKEEEGTSRKKEDASGGISRTGGGGGSGSRRKREEHAGSGGSKQKKTDDAGARTKKVYKFSSKSKFLRIGRDPHAKGLSNSGDVNLSRNHAVLQYDDESA